MALLSKDRGGVAALQTVQTDRLDVMLFQCIEALAGAETTMLRIVKMMQERGLRFKVALYGTVAPEIARTCPSLNVEVISESRTRWAVSRLVALLRRDRPKILLSALTTTNVAAVIAAKLARTSTRVVQTEHNPIAVWLRLTGARRAAYLSALRLSYCAADAVVAVSSGVAREIGAITCGKITPHVIYNPVIDGSPAVCLAPPHAWLARSEPPCIVALGQLRPEKGHARLIEAFAIIAQMHRCRMIILGEGPERGKLEQLRSRLGLEGSVLLPGFVDKPCDWLQYASLFVSPSVYEGFGNAIVEAMACGIPIVSTDCPFGPAEILDGGRYGRLVPVGRADLLAREMAGSLEAPYDPDELRNRAAMFSSARSADGYANLLSQFL